MEEYNFQQINYELKDIRNQRKILGERKNSLERKYLVPNFFRKIVRKYPNPNFVEVINQINEYDSNLEKKYLELREKYRDRFDDFTYSELIRDYYKITQRINDLEKRLDRVRRIDGKIKKVFSPKKKNRAEDLIGDIEEELYRRNRAFEDLETEFIRDRGIDIEAMVIDSFSKEN